VLGKDIFGQVAYSRATVSGMWSRIHFCQASAAQPSHTTCVLRASLCKKPLHKIIISRKSCCTCTCGIYTCEAEVRLWVWGQPGLHGKILWEREKEGRERGRKGGREGRKEIGRKEREGGRMEGRSSTFPIFFRQGPEVNINCLLSAQDKQKIKLINEVVVSSRFTIS
jgi:hypothetical protein